MVLELWQFKLGSRTATPKFGRDGVKMTLRETQKRIGFCGGVHEPDPFLGCLHQEDPGRVRSRGSSCFQSSMWTHSIGYKWKRHDEPERVLRRLKYLLAHACTLMIICVETAHGYVFAMTTKRGTYELTQKCPRTSKNEGRARDGRPPEG